MLCEITEKINDTLVRQILSCCLGDKTPEGIDRALSQRNYIK